MITDEQFDREFDTFRFQEFHQNPTDDFDKLLREHEIHSHVLYSNSGSFGIRNYEEVAKEHYKEAHNWETKSELPKISAEEILKHLPVSKPKSTLDDELNKYLEKREPNFYDYLIKYMELKHIYNETELYKKAEVDRKVFSKIRSMRETNHRPSKATAIKLCLALELSSRQTQEMLNTIGHGMSNASLVD